MCIAMSGRVVSVDGTKATVDFCGNSVTAEAGLVKVEPGDYVLLHAGCILQVVSEYDHEQLMELLEAMETL